MAAETIALRRPAFPPPPVASFSHHTPICIYHPTYPYPNNISLLTLCAFDGLNGSTGLHYGTAIVACGIIAGNRWDGYLTESQTGERIRMGWNEVLRREMYYFHVPMVVGIEEDVPPSPPNDYPVVPCFQDWIFPHHNLPPTWSPYPATDIPSTSPSDMASAVLARDPSCRLSSYRDCGSCAHICPSAQTSWFTTNGMQRYNLQQQSSFIYLVDDVRNRLVLRLDLHSDFDKKKFVFVPKMGMLVTHMLQPTYELGRLYHNIPLLETPDVSIEFLLARFAWSIFPSINGFLAAGVPRLLQRASLQQDACPKSMLVKASAQICRELGGAKAPSPTKRKAPTGGREDDAGSDNEGHSRKRVRASPFSGDAGPSRSPSDDGDEEAGDCSVTLPQYSYGCTATAKGIYRRGLTDDTPDCDTLRLSIEEGF